MTLNPPVNKNYCAVVCEISSLKPLAGCDNVVSTSIFGNQVIVGKDTKIGDVGLFFPLECALSPEFLSANNLYRNAVLNADQTKKGYFEDHGRIKCVKFRGHKSEGFFIPLQSLFYLSKSFAGKPLDEQCFNIGDEFDKIDDQEICRKYIPRNQTSRGANFQNKKVKSAKPEDKILPNQFRFHFDTDNLRRNIHKINPSDIISITDKWHGTSVVIGNLLVQKELKWYEKLAAKFLPIQQSEYGIVWSSRCVIKGVNGQSKNINNHYYGEDVWGVIANTVSAVIPPGFTVYGEIVGFTPSGSAIQKGYHYGCKPGQHKLLVYRITQTGPDGTLIELTFPQIVLFCEARGLSTVRELYYGPAAYLFSGVFEGEHWNENFLQKLEEIYVNDKMCSFNNNEVPSEGIVLRVDRGDGCDSYKLKSFKFLEWETKQLDKGEVDLETEESITTDEI